MHLHTASNWPGIVYNTGIVFLKSEWILKWNQTLLSKSRYTKFKRYSRATLQIKNYQKRSRIGLVAVQWKVLQQIQFRNTQLWTWITPATEEHRGKFFDDFLYHSLLYHVLKSRVQQSLARASLAHLKVLQKPKFRPFFGLKIPKSCSEFVLPRARLRGILPDWAEKNFTHQPNIDLQILYTEFFSNFSVLRQNLRVHDFDPLCCGLTLYAVGQVDPGFSHTIYY
jgi:hypothetical protein